MTSRWYEQAACAGVDINLFYPEGNNLNLFAMALCRRCPVRAECLAEAVARDEPWGIWGGMTPRERDVPVSRRA